jgi:hypothetical protein
MSKASYEFSFLDACEARQLVRVKIEERGEWAIVGARERSFFPLVVLTGTNAPYCINLHQGGHIDGDFDRYAVLRFGADYEIEPDHAGPCEIGPAQSLNKPGSFLLAGKDRYLLARAGNREGMRYFDIATGKLHGEPGGDTAWFAGWALWAAWMTPTADRVPLLEFLPSG